MMMQFVGTAVFSGAALAAGATMWSSVSPQWRRIVRLAAGIPDATGVAVTALARAERGIVVRQWSPSQRRAVAWREAA